ncbi:MAG: RNA methyltransferase [Planctomycetota bacterium]
MFGVRGAASDYRAGVLTSVSNPKVKAVVRLRKGRERRRAGLFIAEGLREVGRALDAGLRAEAIYRCDALLSEPTGEVLQSVEAAVVSEAVMRKMSWHQEPEGVLGVFETPAWDWARDLPAADGGALVLMAAGIEKPGNLGAMVRSAAAAGCSAVVSVNTGEAGEVDAFAPQAIRNSTGAVFSMPVLGGLDPEDAVARLKAAGYSIAAAVVPGFGNASGATVRDYDAVPWWLDGNPRGWALAIGPEDRGLDPRWAQLADALVSIPMAASRCGVDSLNASVAAGVLLFHARSAYHLAP